MPPQLALCLTVAFIVFLFARDVRSGPDSGIGLWLPLLWMLINGSRTISEWIDVDFIQHASALQDGSPIDRWVFLSMILGGVCILYRRRIKAWDVVQSNVWLSVYLLYCFIAIFWSDFPFVAFKRWIKILGHPIMALIVLTEPDPQAALRRLMKRSAFVLIPVSILLIKYYPERGRRFEEWSGSAIHIGITTDKNALGYVCLVLGLFFFWQMMRTLRTSKGLGRSYEIILSVGFLAMILWLFSVADSKTPLVALAVGVVVMVCLGFRSANPQHAGAYLIGGVIALAVTELIFGVYESTIRLLGRTITLTDRTEIWEEVLKVDIDPLIGAGFESFWLGDRLERLWEIFPFRPVQAHNGYLETYLNLGWIGVIILAALMVATFRKAQGELMRDREFGRFRMGFLLAVVIYNYTEATFKALHLVWFVFYLIALDCPRREATTLDAYRLNSGGQWPTHDRGSHFAT